MQPPLPLPKPQQLQNQAPRMAEERHTARGRSALRRRGTCWSCRRRCARRLAAPTPHQHQPPPPMQHLLQSCIEASARWTVASGDPRPELPSSQRWTEAQAAGRWSASAVVPRHQRHTRASHPPFRALVSCASGADPLRRVRMDIAVWHLLENCADCCEAGWQLYDCGGDWVTPEQCRE